MEWIAAQLSEPVVAAAVAFVLGGIFNSTATLVTGEIKASREEQRAIARERRENLRSDRLRVVEDTERWFRKWVDCLEEGSHDKIPDVADFPRRSHAVMAYGELLLEWKEIEDLMIAKPHAMTPDEHRRLVGVKRRVRRGRSLVRRDRRSASPRWTRQVRVGEGICRPWPSRHSPWFSRGVPQRLILDHLVQRVTQLARC